MKSNTIGTIGENFFESHCAIHGFTATRPHKDQRGWDFIVEWGELLDPPGLEVPNTRGQIHVQVKTTRTKKSSISINAHSFVTLHSGGTPAFIVIFKLSNNTISHYKLIPIRRKDVHKALTAIKKQAGNRAKCRFSLNHKDINFEPISDAISIIGDAIGTDEYTKYDKIRSAIFTDPGQTGVYAAYHLNIAETDFKALQEMELGLRNTPIPIQSGNVQDLRIEPHTPLLTNYAFENIQFQAEGKSITVQFRYDSTDLTCPGRVYFSRLSQDLPGCGAKMRFDCPPFDLILDFDNQVLSQFEASRTPCSLNLLKGAADFLSHNGAFQLWVYPETGQGTQFAEWDNSWLESAHPFVSSVQQLAEILEANNYYPAIALYEIACQMPFISSLHTIHTSSEPLRSEVHNEEIHDKELRIVFIQPVAFSNLWITYVITGIGQATGNQFQLDCPGKELWVTKGPDELKSKCEELIASYDHSEIPIISNVMDLPNF